MEKIKFIPVFVLLFLLSLSTIVLAQEKTEHQLSDYLVPVAESDLGEIHKSELTNGYWYTIRAYEYQNTTYTGFVFQNVNTGEWMRFEHPVYEQYDTFHVYGDIVYLSARWDDPRFSAGSQDRANLLIVEVQNNVWSLFKDEGHYYYFIRIHEIHRAGDMLFIGFREYDGGIYLAWNVGRFYSLDELSYEGTAYTNNFMIFEDEYHFTRDNYHPTFNFTQSWGKRQFDAQSTETVAYRLRGNITNTGINNTHYILIHDDRRRYKVPGQGTDPYENYFTNYVGLIDRETGEWEDFWEDSWGDLELTNEQKVDGPVHTFILDGSKIYLGGSFSVVHAQENHGGMVGYDFDTNEWFNFDGGTNGSVHSIQQINDYLLVTGNFTMAGDIPVNHAAVWSLTDNAWQDASEWVDVPVIDLPSEVTLSQNYPNPFNPTTQMQYDLPESADVRLEVYNVMGQRVATLVNGRQNAGQHLVSFNATNLASGVYIYRLSAGSFVKTRKMILVK